MAEYTVKTMNIERLLFELFQQVGGELRGRFVSAQYMADDNFIHRRSRTSNDIHAFFELYGGGYFHLRGLTRHMLDFPKPLTEGLVFLTAYRKKEISQIGGEHSLQQDWYEQDPKVIAQQIVSQNPDLF